MSIFSAEIDKFVTLISGLVEGPDMPRERRDLQDLYQHLLAIVVVRKREGAHRVGRDRQRHVARRGVVPGSRSQPHDGTASGLGDERRHVFAAQEIEGPDRIVQDIAARGVDLRNGHFTTAVVDLVANPAVSEHLGVAQCEVITLPLDDIAAAGLIVTRGDLEIHAIAVHGPETRREAFEYLRGAAGGRNRTNTRRKGQQKQKSFHNQSV